MKTTLKTLAAGLATVLAAAAFSTSASAATPWQREHAREPQVQRYHHVQRHDHGMRGRFIHRHGRYLHHRDTHGRHFQRGWYR